MKPKRHNLPQQYSCLTSKSPLTQLSPSLQIRKKSKDKISKKTSVIRERSNSSSKRSFNNTPLKFSRETHIPKEDQLKKLRSTTQFSNMRQKKQSSKSNIKSKITKRSQSKLQKQNIRLKKALKQSKQQKDMLCQKLQFFKSNAKSPQKTNYSKLTQLTDLVRSLKKAYQQSQVSNLSQQNTFKSRFKTNNVGDQSRQKSKTKLQSILKNIEIELKQIQGHKQTLQNFTNSK